MVDNYIRLNNNTDYFLALRLPRTLPPPEILLTPADDERRISSRVREDGPASAEERSSLDCFHSIVGVDSHILRQSPGIATHSLVRFVDHIFPPIFAFVEQR